MSNKPRLVGVVFTVGCLLFLWSAGNVQWTGRTLAKAFTIMLDDTLEPPAAWMPKLPLKGDKDARTIGLWDASDNERLERLCPTDTAIKPGALCASVKVYRDLKTAADQALQTKADGAAEATRKVDTAWTTLEASIARRPGIYCFAEAPAKDQPAGVIGADTKPLARSLFCRKAWADAVAHAHDPASPSNRGGLKLFLKPPAEPAFSVSVWSVGMMLSILLIAGAIGYHAKQRWMGILINTQNRISLSRTQVTAWTVLALGAYITIALFNIGLTSVQSRDAPVSVVEGKSKSDPWPTIPDELAVALGITFVSPMAAAWARAPLRSATNQALNVLSPGAREERMLIANEDPKDASLADLVGSEETSAPNEADLSRLQMLIITASLLLGYGYQLLSQSEDLSAAVLVDRLVNSQPYFQSLPAVSITFAALLLISHAAYIGTKIITPPQKQ